MTTKSPEGTSGQSSRHMAPNNPNAAIDLRSKAERGLKLNRAERRAIKGQK